MIIKRLKNERNMAERSRWNLFRPRAKAEVKNPIIERVGMLSEPFNAVAGIPDIVRDTERLRKDSNHDNEFDLFDNMLS